MAGHGAIIFHAWPAASARGVALPSQVNSTRPRSPSPLTRIRSPSSGSELGARFWDLTIREASDYPENGYLPGIAPVAQGIERRFPKPCVAGSNPAGGAA